MVKSVLLATRNQGKIKEIESIFSGLDHNNLPKLLNLDDIPAVPPDFDVVEDGKTYEDNAVKKAIEYGRLAGMLTLADDSGLEVEALSGRPGVYSARYGTRDSKTKCLQLLNELKDVPLAERRARFVCVIAIYNPISEEVKVCRGIYPGRIITEIRGNNGFGFDPIFLNEDLGLTNAEMSINQKNKVSHRRKALEQCYKILQSYR